MKEPQIILIVAHQAVWDRWYKEFASVSADRWKHYDQRNPVARIMGMAPNLIIVHGDVSEEQRKWLGIRACTRDAKIIRAEFI